MQTKNFITKNSRILNRQLLKKATSAFALGLIRDKMLLVISCLSLAALTAADQLSSFENYYWKTWRLWDQRSCFGHNKWHQIGLRLYHSGRGIYASQSSGRRFESCRMLGLVYFHFLLYFIVECPLSNLSRVFISTYEVKDNQYGYLAVLPKLNHC